MKNVSYILGLMVISLLFLDCNLTKEVEIELPEYEDQIAVESYLSPGEPFTLLLTRATNYFAPFDVENIENFLLDLLVADAEVRIRYGDQEITLSNTLTFSPTSGNIVNYASEELVPEDFETIFELNITLSNGELIESTTRLMPVIPIDTIIVNYTSDSLAQVLTELTDNPDDINFYRRMLHKTSIDSFPDQDFIVDDEFSDTEKIVFGTGFDYELGDKVINTMYHISRDHFHYLESIQNAVAANANPFGQPGKIVSNVYGKSNPLGIFTGINMDQKVTIIGE